MKLGRAFWISAALLIVAVPHARADFLLWQVDPNSRSLPATDAQGKSLAGESTSAVIPAGKNAACPAGRFLATLDVLRPETTGMVRGRDLNSPTTGPFIEAKFSGLTDASDYTFLSNDHDLVALPNGDLLLAIAVGGKTSIDPEPFWFDTAYRGDFGPGARSPVLVWKSTDCGETFHYVSIFDPARALDGSCALPQAPNGRPPPTGAPNNKTYYDMGGTDGQLVQVDDFGNVYLSFQCVGYAPQSNGFNASFLLDPNKKLNKTLVAVSLDSGESWSALTFAPNYGAGWRQNILSIPGKRFALTSPTGLQFGILDSLGNLVFDKIPLPAAQQGAWGYVNFDGDKDTQLVHTSLICSNSYAVTIAALVGPDIVIAVPSTLTVNHLTTFGYRVFFYNLSSGTYIETSPVVPVSPKASSFIMHLVMARAGDSVLIYWTDIDAKAQTGRIRGRVLLPGRQLVSDFDVARDQGNPHIFPLGTPNTTCGDFKNYKVHASYWYGDYQTAGGSIAVTGSGATEALIRNVYPMWIEPDGLVHFTHIFYETGLGISSASVAGTTIQPLKLVRAPQLSPAFVPKPVPIVGSYSNKLIRQELEEYGPRKRERE